MIEICFAPSELHAAREESCLNLRVQEKESYVKELEELVPQFETVMAEKERLAGQASALKLDLKDARDQQQHSQASLRRAEEVQCIALPTSHLALHACVHL